MEKMKRVIAMAGVIFLVFLYLMTLVSGIMATEASHEWFLASIAATVIVPCFLYAYSMICRILKKQGEDMRQRENAFLKQMELTAKTKAENTEQTKEKHEAEKTSEHDNTNL